MEPVGELDHEHTDVLRHRDDHLAHRLGLGAVAVLQLVELGDPVDEHGDLVAEILTEVLEGVLGVFDGVMQQGGRKCLRSDSQFSQNLGHGDRVRDVRLTALALLSPVRLLRGHIRALEQRDIGLGMMRADRLDEPVYRARRLCAREDAGQQGAQRGGALRCLGHTTTSCCNSKPLRFSLRPRSLCANRRRRSHPLRTRPTCHPRHSRHPAPLNAENS